MSSETTEFGRYLRGYREERKHPGDQRYWTRQDLAWEMSSDLCHTDGRSKYPDTKHNGLKVGRQRIMSLEQGGSTNVTREECEALARLLDMPTGVAWDKLMRSRLPADVREWLHGELQLYQMVTGVDDLRRLKDLEHALRILDSMDTTLPHKDPEALLSTVVVQLVQTWARLDQTGRLLAAWCLRAWSRLPPSRHTGVFRALSATLALAGPGRDVVLFGPALADLSDG